MIRSWHRCSAVLLLLAAGLARAAGDPPDILSVPADLANPPVTTGDPAPGKMVLQALPPHAGADAKSQLPLTPTDGRATPPAEPSPTAHPEGSPYHSGTSSEVRHALYLPTDWAPGRTFPVIVEYLGNSRRVREGGALGYGLSGGQGFIWAVLPYVGRDHASDTNWWWGDLEATVAYAKAAVPEICRKWGGDPARVVLVGMSRGAIACNYIGLHDDEIARLWRAMIPFSHYDNRRWGMTPAEADRAPERLRRLGATPQLVCGEHHLPAQHRDETLLKQTREGGFATFAEAKQKLGLVPMSEDEGIRAFIAQHHPQAKVTFLDLPYVNHSPDYVLRDIPERAQMRAWLQAAVAEPGGKGPVPYQPTRESLSQHRVPEWYQDAKIGFFYHWGPQSVVGDKFDQDALAFCRASGKYAGLHAKNPPGQWGATMYPKPGKPERQQNGAYLLQKKWYGDPGEFGYRDLIPLMSGDQFDPEGMVELLAAAGVKYIAPMAVHHDGFAMWDSKVINEFNAAKMGPKKDTTRLVIEAARKRGLRVGVSTHVMRHSWYYPKLEGYDTGDPRYVQLYGEGLGAGGLPKPAALKKWEDTLKELIDTFHPDYIFSDGDTADIFCNTGSYVCTEAFRRIVAYYYNAAQAWGGEPVITFKRESLYKEEAVPDYEGGQLFDIAPYKWQTHRSICGWFYRNGESVTPSRNLFRDLLDVVSKNGNMLISLGLKGNGAMQDGEVAFLKDLATWTRVVGEGIFATRPWLVYGELEPGQKAEEFALGKKGIVFDDPATVRKGRLKLHEGDIRFTRSKDGRTIYAARLSWPETPFTLAAFSDRGAGRGVKVDSVSLLGSDEVVRWTQTGDGITISPPGKPVFADRSWPVVFRLTACRT